jgi:anti-sigma factor RsiW
MRMIHQEIEDNEIIERYVCHQLSPEERRAFQEHFFACDGCFDNLQMTARLIAGVREASVTGVLAKDSTATKAATASTKADTASTSWWTRGFKPAFVLVSAASVILAALLGWLLLSQIPKLRGDVEREKLARQQLEREKQQAEQEQQQGLANAKAELAKEREQLEQERNERAKLQKQLEELTHNQSPSVASAKGPSQANAPIVILEALRDSQTGNELEMPANASSATLWAEVEPGNRFSSFSVQIFTREGRRIATVVGARRNAYGAVAVNFPAKVLPAGQYVVKLYGIENGKHEPIGEFDLRVRRK